MALSRWRRKAEEACSARSLIRDEISLSISPVTGEDPPRLSWAASFNTAEMLSGQTYPSTVMRSPMSFFAFSHVGIFTPKDSFKKYKRKLAISPPSTPEIVKNQALG